MDPVNPSGLSNASAFQASTDGGMFKPIADVLSSIINPIVQTPGVNELVSFVGGYLQSLPDRLMAGDVAALVVAMILSYVVIVFLNKLTHYLINVVKNLMILTIIAAAFYTIVGFFVKGLGENPNPTYVIFGVIAIGAGFIAVLLAIYFALFHARAPVVEKKPLKGKVEVKEEAPLKQSKVKELFSLKEIKKGKHTLVTMLTYILIAEFGVFSSVTTSAPSVEVGLVLFVAFFAGVSVYIFRTYPNPTESLKLLLLSAVFAFFLSLVLGVMWSRPGEQMSWDVVLSLQYFVKPTLIAFLTGIALSLFMVGKDIQEFPA